MLETDFQKLVENCRKKNLNKDIHNSAWPHALILFKELLTAATEHGENVCIVTGNLKAEFYDQLTDVAQKCLDADLKIELNILEPDANVSGNSFAELIKGHDRGIFSQATTSDSIHIPHFILVGNKRYRFEVNHAKTKAIANFNNQSMGEALKQLFSSLKKDFSSQPSIAVAN